jgi:hypothetical protein
MKFCDRQTLDLSCTVVHF